MLVDVVLMGVEGRAWLGVMCRGVFYGVYFRCSANIRHLSFVFSELPVSVRLEHGCDF